MESNNEIKEIDINYDTCYYFDYIFNIDDLDLDNILLGEKLFEIISIFNFTYKTPYGEKPLYILLLIK